MRPVFVKFNRMRKEEYRIATVISKNDDGVLSVTKKALIEAGKTHISGFVHRYELLTGEGRDIDYIRPELSKDGMSVTFPYIEGRTLSDVVADKIRISGDAVTELNKVLTVIVGGGPVHNIDSILENYLVKDDKIIGIDYEWVTEEEQNRRYVIWRIVRDFYNSHKDICKAGSEDEFVYNFEIKRDEIVAFRKLEYDFQREVAGDTQAIYFDAFRIESRDMNEATEIIRKADIVLQYENLKDAEINMLSETKRLTDNHVHNLEITIRNLRHEVDEQKKVIDHLTKREMSVFKLKRKLGEKFNARFPKGSRERLRVLHPIKYAKLRTSESGKLLLEGAEKIGNEYLISGKLRFPEFADPKVSIIIPCYNQVDYTYRCLKSILDHTGDVTYEIIIADDVSGDATAELGRFTEGLVISRNETNQGFLLNCNNAAKKARGEYIMFLNNDTQVTPGWLKSLAGLLDRDETIGMTGSKLVFPDGKLQEAGGIVWSDGSAWNYGRGDDSDRAEYNYVKDVDYISGAAILIRKKLWEEIGGFDTRYVPAYCEDSDLAFEVRKHGYRVTYQPLSTVVHYEGISNGTDVEGTGLKKYQKYNAVKLREKWSDELRQQEINTGDPDPFRARERSRDRKIILVIDHYVPTPDKDAGSRTTFQYLKMFVNKGYQVKFIGDTFRKDEPYTTMLEQLGIEVLYGDEYRAGIRSWIFKHIDDIHAVYLNRPDISIKYIDYIKAAGGDTKIIYYGHDLHFLREFREYTMTGDQSKRESSDNWKLIELGLMHKADVAYYPSYVECDAIREIDDKIRTKAITAYIYDRPSQERIDFSRRKDILFVGGFSHPPNKDGVLWFINNVWDCVHEETGADFLIVGSHADDEVKALHNPDKGIVFRGFVSDEELEELYSRVKMVAAPLRFGAGIKGKIIEALYHGIPVATTNVGAEGIEDADSIMSIEDSAADMAQEIIRLYNDNLSLEKMSEIERKYIGEYFSEEAAWKKIEEDFR